MAISLVQSNEGISATATTNPSFAVAPTSGNLIVLCFSADDYNGTPDSGWTQSTGCEQQTYCGSYVWWRISNGSNPPGSYTIGSATVSAWVLLEFSGCDASPYDLSNGQLQQTSSDSYTTPSIIPTAGDRVLVAAMGAAKNTDQGGVTSSWLNSFTFVRDIGTTAGATDDVVGVAYRLVTGDGSTGYSSGCTFDGIEQAKTGIIIAFKAATAAAFGDLIGTLAGSGVSVTDPSDATGSVVVAVGDLIVAQFAEENDLTVTAVTDNLSNTYTAQNAGTDAGAVTGRVFYSRATNAGTLTAVHFDTTASNNNWAAVAAVFAGDFASPPIDANASNSTSDVTSPFTCPATGTLAQADELIVAWGVANQTDAWAATSPNLLAVQQSGG